MKKLDKLVLKSFFGPFFLTFVIVVFILLMVNMLRYFDDLVGKGLGFDVFAELMFSFSVIMTPNALPLAVLLSSIMTFGNLGEHFELTAIKSAGVSLIRVMSPIFLFTLLLCVVAYFSNNYIVPKAALNAYSLMYDVKQQKPSLNIKEGAFYNGIQDFTIKVNKKEEEGELLKELMIYDHSARKGNVDVIIADSGRMYSMYDNRYLVMELYNGERFSQVDNNASGTYRRKTIEPYVRSSFDKKKIFFSLEDFDLKKTKKELFANNRAMKDINQLENDIDSMYFEVDEIQYKIYVNVQGYYGHHLREEIEIPEKYDYVKHHLDSVRKANDSIQRENVPVNEQEAAAKRENENRVQTTATTSAPVDTTKRNLTPLELRKINEENRKQSLEAARIKQEEIRVAEQQKNRQGKSTTVRSKKISNIPPQTTASSKKSEERKMPPRKKKEVLTMPQTVVKVDSLMALEVNRTKVVTSALTKARQMKNHLLTQKTNSENLVLEARRHGFELHKKYALALACLAMFLIGAPLGAIVKKGGVGVPVIFSIVFYILFYVLNITGGKMSKQGLIEPWFGAWMANFVLFPIGLFFLRQARIDARLFDMDFYHVAVEKITRRFKKKSNTTREVRTI